MRLDGFAKQQAQNHRGHEGNEHIQHKAPRLNLEWRCHHRIPNFFQHTKNTSKATPTLSELGTAGNPSMHWYRAVTKRNFLQMCTSPKLRHSHFFRGSIMLVDFLSKKSAERDDAEPHSRSAKQAMAPETRIRYSANLAPHLGDDLISLLRYKTRMVNKSASSPYK